MFFLSNLCLHSVCAFMCIFISGWILDIISFHLSRNFTSQVVGWVGSLCNFGGIFSIYPPRFHSRPVLRLMPCAGNQISSILMSVTPMLRKRTTESFGSESVDFFTCHIHVDGLHVKFLNVYVFAFLRLRHCGVARFYNSCAVCCVRFGMAWISTWFWYLRIVWT